MIIGDPYGHMYQNIRRRKKVNQGKLFSEPGKKKKLQQGNFVGYIYLQLPNKSVG
jgi:hypothetical protein